MILALLVACAEDRALLDLPVRALGAEAEVQPVAGVTVTLTTATLTLSDLRLEGPPETARLLPLPFVSPAMAHPGHDFAGSVGGELLGTWTLDLLGGEVELGVARAYEGAYETARLHLEPSPEVLLEGTALVDGAARAFRFALAPDQELTGLSFVATLDAEAPPTGLTLAVSLAHALSFVAWDAEDEDGDGLLTTSDGAMENTVSFGVVSTPTYTIDLEE